MGSINQLRCLEALPMSLRIPVLVPTLAVLGFFLLSGVADAADFSGLPLWEPGDPDPTYPFSDRKPAVAWFPAETNPSFLEETGFDVEAVEPAEGGWRVRVNVDEEERAALVARGGAVRILRNLALEARRSGLEGRRDWTDWPTFPEYEAELASLAASYPNLCRVVSIGQSVQGRDLWCLKITDNPDLEENEPEFRFTSSIHGDEVTGMDLCMRLARLLLESYGTDPTLTEYVDEIELWMMPLHNPDGYVAVSRYNAHGVDLNRDYPDPVDDPIDDPAGREPETQAMMLFGTANRFCLSVNYHGGALVVNYPWDSMEEYTPDHEMVHEYALGYSYRNPPMWNSPYFPNGVTIGWEWYVVHGGLQDWCYHWRSDLDYTIEVSDTKWPAYWRMDSFWDDNREAMLWLMERSLRGLRGLVTDAETGDPLDATIDVVEIGKTIRNDPDVGDYHRLLLPGTYTITCEVDGYVTRTIPGIAVDDGPATVLDIAMEPLPAYLVSGTVTDQTSGDPLAATVAAYFHDGGALAGTADCDPGTGDYQLSLRAGTYDLIASAEGYVPESRLVDVDGDRVEDFALQAASEQILVVRDGAATTIPDALDQAGIAHVVETAQATDPALWSGYRMLCWSAGGNSDPLADATLRGEIEAFVAAGGRLLIEGGQVGYDVFRNPGYPSFGANVLHCADWDVSDAGDLALREPDHALATTPNLLPADLAIDYQGVADNDAVEPLPEANVVYGTTAFPDDAGILVYDDDPGTPADGQIVYFAFHFDRLPEGPVRAELVENAATYLTVPDPTAADDLGPLVSPWIGLPRPNPAFDRVRFRVDASIARPTGAVVVDPTGRIVARLEIPVDGEGPFEIVWDGRTASGRRAPAGVYFLRVRGADRVMARQVLWVGD
ncbi:MAG: hypothetical protein GF346_10380 [Candidatus Eisenbacteria bacterium]|nr:hypothetical protein [Candidatus Latescibacterota bacterium]MBD3302842.1 hypothetical protein [Candidatus Eisenbacteria bacterium]